MVYVKTALKKQCGQRLQKADHPQSVSLKDMFMGVKSTGFSPYINSAE
jgi:hypothetical protein